MDWIDDALCRKPVYDGLWFGMADEVPTHRTFKTLPMFERQRIVAAKSVCERCPVLDTCRRHAVTFPEAYGIWGGTTRAERVAARTIQPVPAAR